MTTMELLVAGLAAVVIGPGYVIIRLLTGEDNNLLFTLFGSFVLTMMIYAGVVAGYLHFK